MSKPKHMTDMVGLPPGVVMPPPTNPDRVLGLELQPGAWVDAMGPVLRETDPDIALAHEDQSGRPDCQPADLSKE